MFTVFQIFIFLFFWNFHVNFFVTKRLENFAGKGIVNSDGGSGINEYVKKQFDASITWKDVKWLVGYVWKIYFLFFFSFIECYRKIKSIYVSVTTWNTFSCSIFLMVPSRCCIFHAGYPCNIIQYVIFMWTRPDPWSFTFLVFLCYVHLRCITKLKLHIHTKHNRKFHNSLTSIFVCGSNG